MSLLESSLSVTSYTSFKAVTSACRQRRQQNLLGTSKHTALKSIWHVVLLWSVLLLMQIKWLNLLFYSLLDHFKIKNPSWFSFKSVHIAPFTFSTRRRKCSWYKCDSFYKTQSPSKHKAVIRNNFDSPEQMGEIKQKDAGPWDAEARQPLCCLWVRSKTSLLAVGKKYTLPPALHQHRPKSKILQMVTCP